MTLIFDLFAKLKFCIIEFFNSDIDYEFDDFLNPPME